MLLELPVGYQDVASAEDYSAIRARLRGPSKVVNLHRPAPQRPSIDENAHVVAYREFLAAKAVQCSSPRGYMRFRCFELGFCFDDLISKSRKRDHVAVRHQIIAEVKERFEHLSFPQLARLFGGLDHTSIIYAMKKHGYQTGGHYRLSAETVAAIREMYAAGATSKQIAAHFGCAANTVRMHVEPGFKDRQREWNRISRENAKRISSKGNPHDAA